MIFFAALFDGTKKKNVFFGCTNYNRSKRILYTLLKRIYIYIYIQQYWSESTLNVNWWVVMHLCVNGKNSTTAWKETSRKVKISMHTKLKRNIFYNGCSLQTYLYTLIHRCIAYIVANMRLFTLFFSILHFCIENSTFSLEKLFNFLLENNRKITIRVHYYSWMTCKLTLKWNFKNSKSNDETMVNSLWRIKMKTINGIN